MSDEPNHKKERKESEERENLFQKVVRKLSNRRNTVVQPSGNKSSEESENLFQMAVRKLSNMRSGNPSKEIKASDEISDQYDGLIGELNYGKKKLPQYLDGYELLRRDQIIGSYNKTPHQVHQVYDDENGGMLDEYTLVIDSNDSVASSNDSVTSSNDSVTSSNDSVTSLKKQRLSKIPKWIRKADQRPQTYLKGPKGGIYYYVSPNEVYYVPKV